MDSIALYNSIKVKVLREMCKARALSWALYPHDPSTVPPHNPCFFSNGGTLAKVDPGAPAYLRMSAQYTLPVSSGRRPLLLWGVDLSHGITRCSILSSP